MTHKEALLRTVNELSTENFKIRKLCGQVMVERDRYRQALEELATYWCEPKHKCHGYDCPCGDSMNDIAEKALK